MRSIVNSLLQEIDPAKIRALYDRPGTPGEKQAALHALKRMGHDPEKPTVTQSNLKTVLDINKRKDIHDILKSKGFHHDHEPASSSHQGYTSYFKNGHYYDSSHRTDGRGNVGSYASPEGDSTFFRTHDEMLKHVQSLKV